MANPIYWDELIAELKAFNEWYGDNPGMSGYVGVDHRGQFYGGVNTGGEWMQEEDMAADGETVELTVMDIIRRCREYRERIDKERAEWEEDNAASEDANR